MMCTNSICVGGWAEHGQNTGGYYKCNRYDSNESNNPEATAAQKAKAGLDRYLHYYQRYHGHDSALKFANTLREQVERKMVAQQENAGKSLNPSTSNPSGAAASATGSSSLGTVWIDVQFLKQAAEQVIDCRRVLKYTYVLGFFLADHTPEKQLFEYHQEMLEKHTEVLHEFTEKPFDQIDRSMVVNETRVVQNFMASLLTSLSGGVVRLDDTTTFPNTFATSSSSTATTTNNSKTATPPVKAK
jgi:ariadne-1